MSRRLHDWVIGAASLALLLLALMAVDVRVRDQVLSVMAGRPSQQLSDSTDRARSRGQGMASAARHYGREHGPLMVFTIAGAVFLIFMLRT